MISIINIICTFIIFFAVAMIGLLIGRMSVDIKSLNNKVKSLEAKSERLEDEIERLKNRCWTLELKNNDQEERFNNFKDTYRSLDQKVFNLAWDVHEKKCELCIDNINNIKTMRRRWLTIDREDKIKNALDTLCRELNRGQIFGLHDDYNCKGINCETCLFNYYLFNSLDNFKEFLHKYRNDKSYGNG